MTIDISAGPGIVTAPITLAEWLAGLRSGLYKQGQKSLFNGGYCCLGLACRLGGSPDEVLDGKGYPDRKFISDLPKPMWHVSSDGSVCEVGVRLVKDWRYLQAGEIITASLLNDGGYSFAEIADLIEATARGYRWEPGKEVEERS